jgi:hypothetical protein
MKKLRDDGLKILVVAALWWIGGYAIGSGVTAFLHLLDVKVELSTIAAWANVVLGLVLLLSVIGHPHLSHLFFDGPTIYEEGDIAIGCLWVVPFLLIVIGLIFWLLNLSVRFFPPK